jgi:hypothetical protein
MPRRRNLDPDSISLGDVAKMDSKQWRIWTFLRLNSIDEKLREHDCMLDRIEGRMWAILTAVILSILSVILTALM